MPTRCVHAGEAAVALMLGALSLGAAFGPSPVQAQERARPPLMVAATGDSVRILLADPPPLAHGFVVYRSVPGGESRRLTPEPVFRVRDPSYAAALIGADLPAVMRAVRAREPGEMLRRLESDDFAGDILSLLYPSVARVLGRLWIDTTAVRGATYEYRVVFTSPRGAETDRTATSRVAVTDIVPAPPTNLRASPGDGSVQLGWSYPRWTGSPRDLVIGFHVFRAEGSEPMRRVTAGPVLRDDAAPMTYDDTTAANGVRYRYELRAVDVAGRESAPSERAAVQPVDRTRPALVTALAAEPGDGHVRLTWRAAREPDAAGYQVERSTGLDEPYRRLTTAPIPAGHPVFDDTTVTGGTQYFYRVIVVDESGNASPPSTAISALPVDKTPPLPPSGVVVRPASRRLAMRWTASPSRDVLGYYIYRGESADRLVRLVRQPVSGTTFIDSGYAGAGLSPGGRYTIHVAAVDRSYNESPPVAAETAVPDDDPPAPPTGFEARNTLGRSIDLTWSASPSVDVVAYVLERADATAGGQASSRRSGVRSDTVRTAAGGTRRDTLVTVGARYAYSLVAIDSAGNRSTPAVDTVLVTDPAPPPAPRHATATVVAGGVRVSWERVVDEHLAGYHVYRSAIPTGVFERLTTAAIAQTAFVDPRGQPGFYYVVRAVDRSMKESRPSDVVRPTAAATPPRRADR